MPQTFKTLLATLTGGFLLLAAGTAPLAAETLADDIVQLQHDWARANYQTAAKAQEAAFETLAEQAHQITERHTQSGQNVAEAMIWEAIVLGSYAKVKGGLGALKQAEKARDLLLGAERINPQALQSSVYTTLGSLYYKVPGWPLGFGDKKKARAYLEKSLELNPDGIDANYFYADFLRERGEYEQALRYYEKALAAPARPGREDADAGRRKEIEAGMEQARKKL